MDCSRPPPRAGTRTQATTVSLCTSSPAHRSISVSILLPSAVRRSLSSRSLRCVLVATVLSPPRLPRLTHRRAHWRQGASTSPDGGGNFHQLRVGRKGPWILIGAPRAPPPPRCAIRPRAPPARLRPRATAARDCEHPQPPQLEGRAHEIPIPAHLRHAAEGEATKAHRLLALRVPAKDVPYARGPNSAAGRRGRRRSAYEAPRAAADRGPPLGGAESKRSRRPRLPAPPSWVTLLDAASSAK